MRHWASPLGTMIILACLLVENPARAEFCMLTQNALRLGHGEAAYADAKRALLRDIFQDYALVVVQEVMDPAEPGRLVPEGFTALVSAPKGRAGYVEYYAVLARSEAVTVLDLADYPDSRGHFARAPFGVAVEDDSGSYWVVTFHAVFGKNGKAPRRAEVAAISEVMAWFSAREVPGAGPIERVVVAGDWNLAATDAAFATLAEAVEGLRAAPDLKTTLNAGGILSSPYDRFVWNSSVMSVDFADEPRDSGGLALPDYRRLVSDHVGVAGWVTADPEARRPDGVACPPNRNPLVAAAD